jgi:ABC-type lipoprotein export system ATPase subunit
MDSLALEGSGMKAVLKADRLTKVYGTGPLAEEVLRGASLSLEAGETCLLLGPSGSGKTTLLSILGCLLSPTGGALTLAGRFVDFGRRGALAEIRRRQIGFVFQHAQLLPFLTLEDNLRVVGRNAGLPSGVLEGRIDELTGRLGIDGMRKKLPDCVSGGQRQRFAVARALLHGPAVVLADEPTAALDRDNGDAVIDLLIGEARRAGAVLLTVSHDLHLVDRYDRVLHMEAGTVCEQRGRQPA